MEKKGLYFEDIREGDEAPPLAMANITRTQIVKYAGASGDFNPIHHDELYAIRAGNDRVFAMGMMTAGFLSHMVTDWVGDGNLGKYKVRFATRIWPGDTVTCKGKITKKHTKTARITSKPMFSPRTKTRKRRSWARSSLNFPAGPLFNEQRVQGVKLPRGS
jgi:acyl dehydratase